MTDRSANSRSDVQSPDETPVRSWRHTGIAVAVAILAIAASELMRRLTEESLPAGPVGLLVAAAFVASWFSSRATGLIVVLVLLCYGLLHILVLSPVDSIAAGASVMVLTLGLLGPLLFCLRSRTKQPAYELTSGTGHQDSMFQSLLETIDGIIWEVDAETFRFTFVSRQAERILGYPIEQWLNDPNFWYDKMHPDDRDATVQFCRDSTAEGKDHAFEYRMIAADDRVVWLRDCVTLYRKPDGTLMLRGVMVDVTEMQDTRQQLEQSEARFRTVVEGSFDALCMATSVRDETGQIVDFTMRIVTDATEDFLPRSEATYIGRSLLESFPFVESTGLFAKYCNVVVTGEPFEDEVRIDDPMLNATWVRHHVQKFGDGVAIAVRDVTPRRAIDEALQASEQQLRLVLESANMVLWTLQVPDGTIHGGPDLARMHEIESREAQILTFDELFMHVHSDDLPVIRAKLDAALQHGQPYQCEYRVVRRDGSTRWISTQGMVQRDDAGSVLRLTGASADITERKGMEMQLRESENRLRLVVENIEEVFWLASHDGSEVIYVSPAFEKVWGISTEEISKHPERFAEMIHPKDRDRMMALIERQGETGYDTEFRIIRPDGETRWIRDRAFPIPGSNGRVPLSAGIAEDITARREAEEARERGKKQLRLIADAVPALIGYVGADYRYRFNNKTYSEWFGIRTEDIEGRHVREIVGEEIFHLTKERFQQALEGKHVEYIWLARTGGTERWLQTKYIPDVTANGSIRGVIVMSTDITSLRESEQQLLQSTERLKTAQSIGKMGDWSYDLRHDTPVWSDEVYTLFEQDSKDGPVPLPVLLDRMPEADRQRVEDGFKSAIRDGHRIELDYEMRLPSGRRVFHFLAVETITNEDGKVVHLAGTVQDITERKQSEFELRQSRDVHRLMLRELDHRVRNNLAALSGLIDLTASNAGSVEDFAESIQARVKGMVAVHSLLSINRWDPVGFRRLIQTIVPSNLHSAVTLYGPDIQVMPRQLSAIGMVLQELVTNAMKHGAFSTSGGRVEIIWESRPHDLNESLLMELTWRERGGPEVTQPKNHGLGTDLITGFIESELNGAVTLSYPRDGATHTLQITLEQPRTGSSCDISPSSHEFQHRGNPQQRNYDGIE